MIAHNVLTVRARIAEVAKKAGRTDCPRLVGVTKTRPVEDVREVIRAGIFHLAENRWAEWDQKAKDLGEIPETPISWHFIGAIQGRSLRRYYRPLFRIDSLDSVAHAALISDLSRNHGTSQDVLIEVNATRERGRSGFLPEDLDAGLGRISPLPGVRVRGLMVMGPVPDPSGSKDHVRRVFEDAHDLWGRLKMAWPFLEELSMGMSQDFEEGILCGATEVRIGRLLFEEGSP